MKASILGAGKVKICWGNQ